MRLLLPFIAALALFACAVEPTIPRTAHYDPAEYAPYLRSGSGKITGQAFMKTMGGDVKYGAGNEVWLHPLTSANREWWDNLIVNQRQLAAGNDPQVNQRARHTTADAEGRFTFTGLPAGDYYLTRHIAWYVPGGDQTGGIAYCQVHVPPGGNGDGDRHKVIKFPGGTQRFGKIPFSPEPNATL